ncbi:kinase-like protein [Rhizophagus irregularis]|uniref:Kinase-like protein n=1 Tax=Rhizophagus irregularis TaxID=588596 RepID=A0A2N0PZY1_9GLOM|nr:kinase-like protein [Rhizophagus irregularis]
MSENSVNFSQELIESKSKILSLVEEVTKKYDEMVEKCLTVGRNKEVHELLSKIEKTGMALSNLRIHKENNTNYFSEKNYNNLCKLVAVIDKIRVEISQLKSYKVEIYRNLNDEFDTTVQLLDLNLEVPFSNFLPRIKDVNFLPLVKEVTKIYNEIIEIYQTAQYNKKTCFSMMKKVEIVDISLRNLRENRKINSVYFSKRNYTYLCSLVNVIDKMRNFVAKISYYEVKNIDENFKYLNDEFDSIVQFLKFSLIISSVSIICTGIETASKVEVLFANFLPLIKQMNNLCDEIDEVYKTAQFNGKPYETMLNRVKLAKVAVNNLKIRNLEFFSEKNYKNFNILVSIIDEIHQYFATISQMKDYSNYEDIDKGFKLDSEFKTALQLLQPFLIINFDDKIIQAGVEEEWIKKKIEEEDIHYFEYSEFNDVEKIGKGGFGTVNRAVTNDGILVALKMVNLREENDIKTFVNELKLIRMVHFHPNVNRFLGLTKDNNDYIMVLEYANEGNLRDYLNKKFKKLQWENKIQMALDITCGLKCLHSKDIIHRDLHSYNILVNNGRLLITDFGLSKQITEVTSNSMGNRAGIIEYTEPQCLKDMNYKKDKRSDIYSLGVLLWEITSGRRPFNDVENRNILIFHIIESRREDPIVGTPLEYQQLYQKCWDGDPEKRPDINQVYNEILSLLNSLNKQSDQSEPDRSDQLDFYNSLELIDSLTLYKNL